MSAPTPCPCCGSIIEPAHAECTVCGYSVGGARGSNVGCPQCARCGTAMPSGYDFCPVCGQDQRLRLWRPGPTEIRIDVAGRSPSGEVSAVSVAGASGPSGNPSLPVVHTVPAPGMRPSAASGGARPRTPVDARTMPAPSSAHRRSSGSLVDAVVDASTMDPPSAMPAIAAEPPARGGTVAPDSAPAHRGDGPPASGQPHHPVAIAPVRAAVAPSTRPDRPGGFSGGPGHGPPPTVNRAQSTGSSGGTGPRLVLVARDGSEGESFRLDRDVMTIGRTHGDVRFPDDPFLSPMHVRLQRNGAQLALFDAGSSNGVYLRIIGAAAVYPGDQFMIGHQLLRLENIDTQIQERPPTMDGTRVFGTPLQPAWGCVRQIGRGGIVGDQYYLRGSQVIFGREGGDLLFPNDPFVSREHACLRLELNGSTMAVFLEDLESANGSYCRIRGSAEITHMDTFRIGDQILRLKLN